MTIDKSIRYEDLPKLNGNVIDITPLIKDEWWKIKEKLEEETNGNLASTPHPDDAWVGLWENLNSQGIVPRGIETLIDFKNWFYKQDLDVELFSRGGIASLIGAKRR